MITINGESAEWRAGLTVTEMLKNRGYSFPLIIVKINDELISKNEYASRIIPDGAAVQAIHLMSGG